MYSVFPLMFINFVLFLPFLCPKSALVMNNLGITKIKIKCGFTLGFTVYMETVEIRLV